MHLLILLFLFFIPLCIYPAKPNLGYASNIKYIANAGQWQSGTIAKAEISGGYVQLNKSGFVYHFIDFEKLHQIKHHEHSDATYREHWYNVSFEGANLNPAVTMQYPDVTIYNFYLGNDATKWATGVKSYERITYHNIYPHIDMYVYSKNYDMKYDLVIKKGANVNDIRLRYSGLDSILIDATGNVSINTALANVTEKKPLAWQIINNKKCYVACDYIFSDHTLTFDVSTYNHNYDLIIDPQIVFSSYTGSQADNWGFCATYDTSGNMYTGGIVYDVFFYHDPINYPNLLMDPNGFPASPGAFVRTFSGGRTDVAIFKFNPTGNQRLYATYLGGNDSEAPHNMVVNSKNELIVYGYTASNNFPITSSAFVRTFSGGTPANIHPFEISQGEFNTNGTDIYISKFNSSGTALTGSTYYGGTDNDGLNLMGGHTANYYSYGNEFKGEVVVDDLDHIYVVSSTYSSNIPLKNAFQTINRGGQEAMVLKFSPNLDQLHFASYFGGNGNDAGFSIQLDSKNKLFFTGCTNSLNLLFPDSALHQDLLGGTDAFIACIDSNKLINGTYIGTSADEVGFVLQVDKEDDISIFGQTWGSYVITPSGTYGVANSGQFLHKVNNSLTKTLISTAFGEGRGFPDMVPTAFSTNYCGDVIIGGWIGNTKTAQVTTLRRSRLPTTPNAIYRSNPIGSGFYFCSFSKNIRSLDYGTFFIDTTTANYTSNHVDGGISRFDKKGYVYQAICAGCGGHNNTPVTPGVWSTTNNSKNCNLLGLKINFEYIPVISKIFSNPVPLLGTVSGIEPLRITFDNRSTSPNTASTSYFWKFGFPTQLSTFSGYIPPNPTFDLPEMGIYTASLIVTDISSCNSSDTSTITIIVNPTVSGIIACPSVPGVFSVIGGNTYHWAPSAGLSNIFSKNPTVLYPSDQTYVVTVTSRDGNYKKVLQAPYLLYKVNESIIAKFNILPDSTPIVFDTVQIQNVSLSFQNKTSVWVKFSTLPGYTFAQHYKHAYTTMGTDFVEMIIYDTLTNCVVSDTSTKKIFAYPYILPDTLILCDNVLGTLSVTGGVRYFWSPTNDTTQVVNVKLTSQTRYYVTTTGFNTYDRVVLTALGIPKLKFSDRVLDARFTVAPDDVGNIPLVITLTNRSLSKTRNPQIIWDFGNGSIFGTKISPTKTSYESMGKYTIKLTTTETVSGCVLTDTATSTVKARPYVIPKLTQCKEDSGTFAIIGGTTYQWIPNTGLSSDKSAVVKVRNNISTDYNVIVSNFAGDYIDTLKANLIIYPDSYVSIQLLAQEKDLTYHKVKVKPDTKVNSYSWQFVPGSNVKDSIATYIYDREGFNTIYLSGKDSNNCTYNAQYPIEIEFLNIPNIFTPNGDAKNDYFEIKGLLQTSATLSVTNRWGNKVYESIANGYKNNWDAANLPDGVYYYKLLLNYDTPKEYNGWLQVLR
ncbi:MAG: gliding motility-associated C-terminal domain-containing protein [Cytophagales bacterium]|nr:gliding motility-associated C-terminal domain-containing protein [Cytophagales bacterium]